MSPAHVQRTLCRIEPSATHRHALVRHPEVQFLDTLIEVCTQIERVRQRSPRHFVTHRIAGKRLEPRAARWLQIKIGERQTGKRVGLNRH